MRTSGRRTAELLALDATWAVLDRLGRVGIYDMPSIYSQGIHAPPTVFGQRSLGW